MIKPYLIFPGLFLTAAALFLSCTPSTELEDPGGLRAKLEALEGVTVVELVPYYDFNREFLLEIEQPIDHTDSSSGTFNQIAYLLHNDLSSPVVLGASGYSAGADDLHEMTIALDANQISVTHRYFSGSVPSTDYRYLNMEQAAGDLHRIVSVFREIYPENWLSSGFGKGALAALAHRRHYPEDVAATVSYSAAFLNGQNDTRPAAYIKTLGDNDKYEKIKMFQETLLKRRSEVSPYVYNYMYNMYYYYNYTWQHNSDWVLEMAVLDYPFDYWTSSNQNLTEIPDTSASADVLFDHLYDVVWMEYYTDSYIDFLEPARIQSMIELGALAYETTHLQDLLTQVNVDSGSNFYYDQLISDDIVLDYSSAAMDDLKSWLVSNGNNIVYLYGDQDPLSAAAIDLSSSATNAIKTLQSGSDHFVRIEEISNADQVYNALEDWMGFEIEPLGKTANRSQSYRFKIPVSE